MPSESAPVSARSLIDELRDRIIDGRYSPGARLSEQAVAEELAVSRNTLREAFAALAEQGVIERIPNRGVSVVAPNMSDIVDMYRMRRLIEPQVLAEASPLHPGLGALEAAVAAGERAAETGDWERVGTANMQFHLALMELSDSPRLVSAFRNLMAVQRLVFLRMNEPERLHGPFIARNREIFDRLVAGEREAAATRMRDYLRDSEELLLATYLRRGFT